MSEDFATIAGGLNNRVGNTNSDFTDAQAGTIGGGSANLVIGSSGTVGGGSRNTVAGAGGTIAGGVNNAVSNFNAVVAGGANNIADANASSIVGGSENYASGDHGTVVGGQGNVAAGDLSFAAGYRAKANHLGAFVWGDMQAEDFVSTAANQFNVRASGGVRLKTGSAGASLDGPLYLFESGTANPARMMLAHSPAFPDYGLQYDDPPDRFHFVSAGFPVMTVDLQSQRVGIGTPNPTDKLTVTGTINSTSGGYKFPDGSVQTSAAQTSTVGTTFTAFRGSRIDSWIEISPSGSPPGSIVHLDLPPGTYLIQATAHIQNTAALEAQDNRRRVRCLIADDTYEIVLGGGCCIGAPTDSDHITVSAHSVKTFSQQPTSRLDFSCIAYNSGTDRSYVFAGARRLTAVKVGSVTVQP